MKFDSRYYYKFLQLAFIFALFTIAGNVFGQTTAPEDRTQKLASKLMKRDMSYRVILPVGYDKNKEARYPVVYVLHGLGGNYNIWGNITDEYFGRHNFIIVFPDGGKSFWTDSVTVPDDKYESHFIEEIIPTVERNFRVIADREHRIISGLSMGGFGAVKLGLKYPEKFSLIGSIAGAIGVSTITEKTFGETGKIIDSVFGPLGGEHRNANGIQQILNKMTPEQLNRLPMIYQSVGTEDALVGAGNAFFLNILKEKKIRHEYRELPGGHDGTFANDQLREFLKVADRHLVTQKKSIIETISNTAKEKGGAAAVAEYRKLKSENPDKYVFYEDQLNQLGYDLLGMDKAKDAIEILKLNVEMFAKSFNPYDSLGEAYLRDGNKELALANYKKSVELNPENFVGVLAVKKLEGKEIKIDSAVLDAYTGEFEIAPGFILTVTKEGGKLMGQTTGQGKVELEPVSETQYIAPSLNAGISFEKDSGGKVTELILNQGGQKINAKKIK